MNEDEEDSETSQEPIQPPPPLVIVEVCTLTRAHSTYIEFLGFKKKKKKTRSCQVNMWTLGTRNTFDCHALQRFPTNVLIEDTTSLISDYNII